MSATPRILHVIERLSLGGAGRSLLGVAKYSAPEGFEHAVISLQPPVEAALAEARASGLRVVTADETAWPAELAATDLVHVHFWNSPGLARFLRREWAPVRLLVWCHVAGDVAPQVITPELVERCDALVASSPYTAELPIFRRAAESILTDTILDMPDFARLTPAPRARGTGLSIVYVGTVDFVKMHPDFVRLHAELEIPGLRVVVCGAGPALPTLRRQAEQSGCPDRFEFLGYREAVGEVLARGDIFGYPLAPENYATSELALQEAMYLGLPPVLLATGGPARMVIPEETGLLATDPRGYLAHVGRLAGDPELREKLGRQAAAHARAHWGAERAAARMNTLYRELLVRPKRGRPGQPAPARDAGAEALVRSLGAHGPQFEASLGGRGPRSRASMLAADRCIARSSALLASPASGGVLHYRFAYPEDRYLRFWSGLILAQQGRPALAALEFRQAIAQGLAPERVRPHLVQGAEGAGGAKAPSTATPPVEAADWPRHANPIAPPWLHARGGLAEALGRLRAGPGTIAYLGNSVTAQRDGYRGILHRWLVDYTGHDHRGANLGIGGVGSFGAACFLHRHFAAAEPPTLCLVECTTGDIGGHGPLETVGPVVEGIVRGLRQAGVGVVLLHLYDEGQDSPRGRAVLAGYERIAERYGVPSIHLGDTLGRWFGRGELSRRALLRDGVHTRPAGAYLFVRMIADGVEALEGGPGGPGVAGQRGADLPPRLFADDYGELEIVPPSGDELGAGPAARWGTYAIVNRYLEIPSHTVLEVRVEVGEIAGIVLINGPHSGGVRVQTGATTTLHELRDKWCYYDRLHVYLCPRPLAAAEGVRFTPTLPPPTPPPSAGAGAIEPPSGALRLMGIVVRKVSAAPVRATFSLTAA